MNAVSVRPTRGRGFRVNAGYLFIAPALILVGLLMIYPVYRLVDMSLHRADRASGTEEFVGIDNYRDVLGDRVFQVATKQTLIFIGLSAIGHLGLGCLLALLLDSKLNRRVLTLARTAILLPWVLSPVVVAILSQLWMHPLFSPIAKVLQLLGWTGTFEPLGHPDTALYGLIIMNIWQYTPFYMLMILVGLQTRDPELDDAAKVDGAGGIQRLYYITWPHIRNVVLTLTLFNLVANAAYFDLIWVATKGGPMRSTEVLATYLYRRAFVSLDFNDASVVAIAILLLSILLAVGVVVCMGRE